MTTSATAFQWLDFLEKEFDRAYIDLELLIGTSFDDYDLLPDVRNKLGVLSSIFAQTAQKALTIFENNAKLEALNVSLKSDLTEALAQIASLKEIPNASSNSECNNITNQDDLQNKVILLEGELNVIKKENDSMRQYILALQGEVYGARLAAKYLDKELAGRIQQLQLISRKMDGPEHERLWNTLEAEIQLHRHKTVVRACQGRHHATDVPNTLQTGSSSSESHVSSPPPPPPPSHEINEMQQSSSSSSSRPRQPPVQENSVRRVMLHRESTEGLGLSVTGGFEHGVPLTISAIHPGTSASLCGQLRVGDIILAVNERDLRPLKHTDAVHVLTETQGDVLLDVMYISPGPDSDDNEDRMEIIADDGRRFRLYDDSFTRSTGLTSTIQTSNNGMT